MRVEPCWFPADDVDHLAFLESVHKNIYNTSVNIIVCYL